MVSLKIENDKDYARMQIIAEILLYLTLFSISYLLYKISGGIVNNTVPFICSGEILS
tara:strand:- start:184 stop:354 length:171 start_codon:yes stop_codon:yes gene_type:complete